MDQQHLPGDESLILIRIFFCADEFGCCSDMGTTIASGEDAGPLSADIRHQERGASASDGNVLTF